VISLQDICYFSSIADRINEQMFRKEGKISFHLFEHLTAEQYFVCLWVSATWRHRQCKGL